jgi:putative two-component system hydrogenase maturation factor HypX/HoxX
MNGEQEWGVTVLQAAEEMDAGDIWATETFQMRQASKACIYRREVNNAAIRAMITAVERFDAKQYIPDVLDYSKPDVRGELRPQMKQQARKIDWVNDDVAAIIKKINAADSAPGVLDVIDNQEYYLYGAHQESAQTAWKCLFQGQQPGEIIAKRHGAICREAKDGVVDFALEA